MLFIFLQVVLMFLGFAGMYIKEVTVCW